MKLLFVTWDGPSTTYHETLFLPLLDRATAPQDEVHLLQFTWDAQERSERLHGLAQDMGMRLTVKDFGQQPSNLAVAAWIVRGGQLIAKTVRREGIDTLLPRSIIPGAMALLARPLLPNSTQLVYDADGLMADERVEFGGWKPNGLRYRLFTALERAVIRRSDHVLVRTSRAVDILKNRTGIDRRQFQIVTNAKNEQVFTPGTPEQRRATRENLGVPPDAPMLLYVGSIGRKYQPERMMDLFDALAAAHPNIRFLVITQEQNHEVIRSLCAPSQLNRLTVLEVPPRHVPKYLAVGDLGLALVEPTLSMRAVAPIKIAEYLLCGVPVVHSAGIGDLDEKLSSQVALRVDRSVDVDSISKWLVDDIWPNRELFRNRARASGLSHYALAKGAQGYASLSRLI